MQFDKKLIESGLSHLEHVRDTDIENNKCYMNIDYSDPNPFYPDKYWDNANSAARKDFRENFEELNDSYKWIDEEDYPDKDEMELAKKEFKAQVLRLFRN